MIRKLHKYFRTIWKKTHYSTLTDETGISVTVSVYSLFVSSSSNFELYFLISAFYFRISPLYEKCERKHILRSWSVLISRHLQGGVLSTWGVTPVVPVCSGTQESRLAETNGNLESVNVGHRWQLLLERSGFQTKQEFKKSS